MSSSFDKDKQNIALGIFFLIFGFFVQSAIPFLIGLFLLYSSYKKGGFSKLNFNSLNNLETIFKKSKKTPMEIIDPNKKKKIAFSFGGVIVLLILLTFASSFWVVIEAGQTGVQSLFGKVRDNEFHSGFHLKNPLVRITKMNIRTQDYTMSVARGEGQKYGADAISALTKEGLSVDLDITVLFHLEEDKASDIYREVGLRYDDVIIRPQIRSVIREVIAQYEAKDIYSEKREEASKQILDKLIANINERGVVVEEVLLRHVELPANLANSIQEKLQAEQEAQRYDFLLEREEKEAQRKRVEAEGQKDAQAIINQSLTRNYLNYLYIQNLEKREGTIYVPVDPNSGMPLFRGL